MSDEDKNVLPDEDSSNPQEDIVLKPHSPKRDKTYIRHVWLGIGILAILHLLLFFFPVSFFFIGVTQIVYLIPATIVFRKNEGVVQGLLIGGGITFLLNAACFGLFISGVLY